jgi:hypothetical protein
MGIVALLTGIYHVSRRKAPRLLSDLVGVPISLGAISAVEARVSEAVKPAVDEAWTRVEGAAVKHTDGTSWLKAGALLALWTIASTAVTVFKIVTDNSRATLEPLYGALRGILVSDRAKALGFWAMERRQICWAHLLRKFVSFAERDGPSAAFGRDLLNYTGILFEYWHDYKAGKLDRATFRAWMAPVRTQVEALLARAAAANIDRVSGSCADILARVELLPQRHDFLDGSARRRLRPRGRARHPRTLWGATRGGVRRRERPLHRSGRRGPDRRNVISYQPLDLFCQVAVCRHALHVARRGPTAQHHP